MTIGYIGSLQFSCYYLQYVPVSKPFDHAWFEVLEAIILYCTWYGNRQFQGKLVSGTRRAKPIRMTGVRINGVLQYIFHISHDSKLKYRYTVVFFHSQNSDDSVHRHSTVVIKSRRMRWTGRVARMGESRGIVRVLVGKPEGKRPLGRPRRRWEDNIKMDLQKVGY
jgi:hypothetical protein